MDLFVGQTSLKGDFRRYAREFNYVELVAEPQLLPGVKKLAALAAETLGKVQFGVVLSPRTWEPGAEELKAYFRKVVSACNPSWVLVRTPPSLRPGSASQRELSKVVSELRADLGNRRLAWEARGLWEPSAMARVAAELSVVPVFDGHSLPAHTLGTGPGYVRFPELGVGARVNEGRLERLAERARDCESLHLVVEGKGARRVRQIVEGFLADPFDALDEAALGLGPEPETSSVDEDYDDEEDYDGEDAGQTVDGEDE